MGLVALFARLFRSLWLLLFFKLIASILFSAHALAADQYELGECGDYHHKNFHLISDVQGSGFTSPLLKHWVIIEGLVTVSLQGRDQYRGFWLQQSGLLKIPANSSRGIFVFHAGQPVRSGQLVRLFAQVAEYKGLTEVKKVRAIKICDAEIKLSEAESITLPVISLIELEAKEGMRVRLSQDLVISDLYGAGYGLGNYGQFAVSSELHMQPTELWTAAQLRAGQDQRIAVKELDYLLVDDASAKTFPQLIPFPTLAGFSTDNPLRITDRVNNLSGILHAYDDHYVVIPEDISAIAIKPAYPRSKIPVIAKGSNLIITSMNLGNYFNGEIEEKAKNGGFPTLRGARSRTGFLLQTDKIVSALAAMDADIIALMEVENDGYGKNSAIHTLTKALNKKFKDKRQYRYIQPAALDLTQGELAQEALGRDVISVGLLYRPDKLLLSGPVRVLNSQAAANSLFDDQKNRPSLIQQFSFNDHEFVVAVNHFKSKGRPCDEVEIDQLQGSCNKTRYRAALALIDFLNNDVQRKPLIPAENKQHKRASLPTLILGDLNSYSQEEPLLALYRAGFINLKSEYQNDSKLPSFSYSYQGLLGNLDHALANSGFLPFIKSVDSWHINSVEDVLLDYNKEENGHQYPSIDTYGQSDMYRSSDHDPVVLGLQFPDASH